MVWHSPATQRGGMLVLELAFSRLQPGRMGKWLATVDGVAADLKAESPVESLGGGWRPQEKIKVSAVRCGQSSKVSAPPRPPVAARVPLCAFQLQLLSGPHCTSAKARAGNGVSLLPSPGTPTFPKAKLFSTPGPLNALFPLPEHDKASSCTLPQKDPGWQLPPQGGCFRKNPHKRSGVSLRVWHFLSRNFYRWLWIHLLTVYCFSLPRKMLLYNWILVHEAWPLLNLFFFSF